jgi:hypothetical protein
VNPSTDGGYRIYYHNSGLASNCVQDWDLDRAELDAFFIDFAGFVSSTYGTLIVADYFGVECELPRVPHGEIVESYCSWARRGPAPVRVENFQRTWGEMIDYIADHYGAGSVANLSNGTLGWDKANTEPVLDAYDAEVLLVGAPLTFAGAPNELLAKVLTCLPMDAQGQYCNSHVPTVVNCAEVGVPTNWFNNGKSDLYIARWGHSGGWSDGWPDEGESGSFTTAIASGSVQMVADALMSRGVSGNFVDKLLDYVISGCDRKGTPQDYSHYVGPSYLASYGPWSPTWGYGQLNPWKALIYAYGWGKIEAKDHSLDPAVQNPEIVFSDDFYLRGDLFIPSGQALRVSPLASIAIDPDVTTPEGPGNLGIFPSLQEIRVAGDLVVETSRTAPFPVDIDGVSSTIVVDDGGVCTIADGGTAVILPGQYLLVQAGGELDIQAGGRLVILTGGHFLVLGEFNCAGTLTLMSGSQTVFNNNSIVTLSSDLNIPSGASLVINEGSTVTVAAADAGATGNDPARVEINCSGTLQTSGSALSPVTIRGQQSGAGTWAGIAISTVNGNGNSLSFTEISDAIIGVAVGGNTPLNLSWLNVHHCGTGVRITGRNNFTLYGGEFTYCSIGVDLDQASINVQQASIHDCGQGVKCTSSSPTVRFCEIYKNDIGISTVNASSVPNLGTTADPGNNDFYGPGGKYPGLANDIHISAFDPSSNIYAQSNWWGTTNTNRIQQRIQVIDSPPAGCGSVVIVPVLSGPPVGGVREPATDPAKDARDHPTLLATTAPRITTFLGQNRPNPFNPTTTIEFGLAERSRVTLEIYDAAGRFVGRLVDGEREAGVHRETWDGAAGNGSRVTSGIYFYRLTTGSFVETKKMILLK